MNEFTPKVAIPPRVWNIAKCADELLESDKSDELDQLIWEVRGIVFSKLKEMGKFDDDAEGPDNQTFVDAVMKRLIWLV